MAYSNEEKAMALSLYLAGKSYRDITEMTGIADKTLTRWSVEGDWDVKKHEHLVLLEKTAAEDITVFKHKMVLQLEGLRDEMIRDYKLAKAPTKDKIVSGIVDVNKQLLLLKGLPTEISKTESKVEVKPMKLEDYFK